MFLELEHTKHSALEYVQQGSVRNVCHKGGFIFTHSRRTRIMTRHYSLKLNLTLTKLWYVSEHLQHFLRGYLRHARGLESEDYRITRSRNHDWALIPNLALCSIPCMRVETRHDYAPWDRDEDNADEFIADHRQPQKSTTCLRQTFLEVSAKLRGYKHAGRHSSWSEGYEQKSPSLSGSTVTCRVEVDSLKRKCPCARKL